MRWSQDLEREKEKSMVVELQIWEASLILLLYFHRVVQPGRNQNRILAAQVSVSFTIMKLFTSTVHISLVPNSLSVTTSYRIPHGQIKSSYRALVNYSLSSTTPKPSRHRTFLHHWVIADFHLPILKLHHVIITFQVYCKLYLYSTFKNVVAIWKCIWIDLF